MTLRGMGLMQMLNVIRDEGRMCRRPIRAEDGEFLLWAYARREGDFVVFGVYNPTDGFMPFVDGGCLNYDDVDAIDWEEYE